MKRLLEVVIIVLLLGFAATAQEIKHEITVQGSGFFTKQTTGSGITSKPTNAGGFMMGYRANLNNWFAVEGDYDYFRNSQKFLAPKSFTQVRTNVNAITAAGVLKLPAFRNVRPFAIAGGGVMVFDPRTHIGNGNQARGTFVYGGGADLPVMKHVALRAQYRGFVYKVPDFDASNIKVDKFTHSAVPSAGVVLTY